MLRIARLKKGTVGRIVDLDTIRNEKARIEPNFKALGRTMKSSRLASPYLQNEFSSLKKRVVYLGDEEGTQLRYRAKYAGLSHGPRLPKEIINKILSFVSSSNMLQPAPTFLSARVDGLLRHAALNPSLLAPYYTKNYRRGWRLALIAEQTFKLTLLDDALLMDSTQLHITAREDSLKDLVRDLRLSDTPRRLKALVIIGKLSMDEFTSLFQPFPPCLEELGIDYCAPLSSTTSVIPLECSSLKTIQIRLVSFSNFLNSGIQPTFLSKLDIDCYSYPPSELSIDAINNLTRTLSQLTRLEVLCLNDFWYKLGHDALHSLVKVKSSSLHSLILTGPSIPRIFHLFPDCSITYLETRPDHLIQSAQFFPDIRGLCIRASTPHVSNAKQIN